MKSIVKKSDIVLSTFMFFVLMFGDFFHLVNPETLILGIPLSDIFLVIYSIWCLWQSIKLHHFKVKYSFAPFFIMLLVSVIIATLQAYNISDQPLLLGFRPQRKYFVLLLTYFPIRKLFYVYNIEPDKIFRKFILWACLSIIIYISFKILYITKGIEYLSIGIHYAGTFSPYRMYIESSLIDIAIIISACYFFKNLEIKYIIPILLGFISQIWISQGRLEILSIMTAIGVGALLTKKTLMEKIFLFLLGCTALVIFINSSVFDSIWLTLVGETQINNTLEIRKIGKQLYIEQILSSVDTFLFGVGYPSMLYEPAFVKTGFYDNIFLSDNGVISFAYIYGIWGLFAILGILFRYVEKAFWILKKKKETIYIMYIVMVSTMAINIIFWYWHADALLILILMICGLEQAVYNLEKNNCD